MCSARCPPPGPTLHASWLINIDLWILADNNSDRSQAPCMYPEDRRHHFPARLHGADRVPRERHRHIGQAGRVRVAGGRGRHHGVPVLGSSAFQYPLNGVTVRNAVRCELEISDQSDFESNQGSSCSSFPLIFLTRFVQFTIMMSVWNLLFWGVSRLELQHAELYWTETS